MARRTKPKFDKKLIVEAFADMAKARNIDRELLQGIIKETLSMLVRKKFSPEAEFEIVVDMEKGDIEIYLIKTVVTEVEDSATQILVSDANLGVEEYEEGDEFLEEITLENIADNFGRRLINMAGQALNQRIRDIEKENVYNEYIEKVNEIIIGEIYQVRRSDVFLLHNHIELRLPREEQIPGERYRKNEPLRAIIKEIRRQGGPSNAPEIVVSRADNEFLARLFEIEIPEIYDGLIEIKGIAREPGERAKVAVFSYDDRIDPVGACVGMKGIRIHSIVRELNNENIDVINFSDEPAVYISRALAPARIKEIQVEEETRSATVLVSDEQVSLAIGKNGQNVRLASKLTGYSISVVKEGGEDIELIEFREELGRELYSNFINAEIDTAREFLEADPEYLLQIPGLSKDKIIELRRIMLEEFDEEDSPEIIELIKNAYDPGATTKDADAPAADGAASEDSPNSSDNTDGAAAQDSEQPSLPDPAMTAVPEATPDTADADNAAGDSGEESTKA